MAFSFERLVPQNQNGSEALLSTLDHSKDLEREGEQTLKNILANFHQQGYYDFTYRQANTFDHQAIGSRELTATYLSNGITIPFDPSLSVQTGLSEEKLERLVASISNELEGDHAKPSFFRYTP